MFGANTTYKRYDYVYGSSEFKEIPIQLTFEVFSLKFPKIWVGYVFFKWYFEKKVGRSGDGKRNNLLGWP